MEILSTVGTKDSFYNFLTAEIVDSRGENLPKPLTKRDIRNIKINKVIKNG